MKPDPKQGLAEIWPRVRAEIAQARQRELTRRKVMRIGAALGLLVLGAVVVMMQFRAGNPAPPAQLWGFQPWHMAGINPAIGISEDYPLDRGKRIFVVQGQGDQQRLVCLEKRTGAKRWTSPFAFSDCRLAADDERVYLLADTGSGEWTCTALKAQNGETLWTGAAGRPAGAAFSALTIGSHGLCWTEGNRLVMRDPATGGRRWTKTLDSSRVLSSPVELADSLYVGTGDQLRALDPKNGDLLWSCQLRGGGVLGLKRPLLKGRAGRIFCALPGSSAGGTLNCIDANTHELLWTQETEAPTRLDVCENEIFVRSQSLSAFEARTGQALWQVSAGGCGTVSFSGNRVYLVNATERGLVLALDGRTGKQLWTQPVAGSCNGIVVSGPVGFLSGNDRILYAFRLHARSS